MTSHASSTTALPLSRTPRRFGLSVALIFLLAGWIGLAPRAQAQAVYWSDGSGDNTWTNTGNWSPAEMPDSTNDVFFIDLGTSGLATTGPNGTPDNIVNSNMTIRSLNYSVTNYTHTTLIDPETSLQVVGPGTYGLFSGTMVDTSGSKSTYATINGPGALLLISNLSGSISARQSEVNSSAVATIDLSGLDTLIATVTNVLVGGEHVNKNNGVMYFAKTNFIVCTSPSNSPGLIFGNNSTSGSKSPAASLLGLTNGIFSDGGLQIPQQRMNNIVQFGNANSTAYFRNQAGTGPQNEWSIGWNQTTGTGTSCHGTLDFTLGTVDAMIGTLVVGGGETGGSSSSTGTGTLNASGGSIVANTVEIGEQFILVNNGVGTINLYATNAPMQFSVASNLYMAYYTGTGTPSSSSTATLNLNAGVNMSVGGDLVAGASGSSTINDVGATLTLGGTVGATGTGAGPLTTFYLSGGTLIINLGTSPNPVNPIITVGTFNGVANCTLQILGGAISDGQFSVIKYESGILGDGFNAFTTVILPPQVQGYLSNNTANQSIDLVVTNVLAPIWNGTPGNTWDINTTADWVTSAGMAVTYEQPSIPGNLVTFNDNAVGSTIVNLVPTNLAPSGISVNNSVLNYTFTGSGAIVGPTGLTKNGTASLVIANTGDNSFTGPIGILNGTLQMGVANGLPSSANITLADTLGATLNLTNFNQSIGTISGGGSDGGGNITLGAATLTLSGNGGNYAGIISGTGGLVVAGGSQTLTGQNTYTSNTLITGGALIVDNTYGSATGLGGVAVQGGALQFGNGIPGADGVIAAPIITNNSQVILDNGDPIYFTNYVTGTGTLVAEGTEVVYINNPNSYSGGTVIESGAVSISTNGALGTGEITIDNGALASLQLNGGVTMTNSMLLYTKAGALGGDDPVIDNYQGTNALLGVVDATSAGTDLPFQCDDGLLIVGSNFAFLSAASGENLWLQGAGNGIWGGSITNGSGWTIQLEKRGTGTWTLTGTSINSYTSNTVVLQGTLIMDGKILSPLAVNVNGATLAGCGYIASPVNVLSGIIQPGDPSAPPGVSNVLTISNSLTLDDTAVFSVTKTNGALSYTQLSGMTSVNYNNATLTVNLTGTLSGTEVLHLFNAASYTGSFGLLNLPTLPATLAWNTNYLSVDGTLRLYTALSIQSASISSGAFQLTGANLPVLNGQGYRILATTNLSLPLAQWTQVSSGMLNGSISFSDANTANFAHRYYMLVSP